MSEMVERVAKAIGDEMQGVFGSRNPEKAARAAIEAMREPTGGMAEHAWMEVPNTIESMPSPHPSTEEQIANFWRNMIDAALDKVDA